MTNTSHTVLITAHVEAQRLKRLQSAMPGWQIELWQNRSMEAIPDELWREVEVLYTSFATPLPSPRQVPRLRWVQLYSAGPDSVLAHALFRTPVVFTTTSGVHAINMAEYIFTVILAWFHRFPRLREWQRKAAWPSSRQRTSLFAGEELRGKTIGIAGYGSIGRQVARLSHAFGMRILAMQRGTSHRDAGFCFPDVGDPEGYLPDRYYLPDQLHAMLSESDIVVIAVPLTQKTRGLFDQAAFQAMKPTAFLLNIARGDICDEAALLVALREKHIAGAALDVFHDEPLSPDHPLWHLPNVFISPHTAGLTPHYDERAATIFEENLRRYQEGLALYNVVDKLEGY